MRRIFPCNDRMVLIIDDRSDVWDGCKNLIPVQPFVFFEGNEQGSDVATTSTSFVQTLMMINCQECWISFKVFIKSSLNRIQALGMSRGFCQG